MSLALSAVDSDKPLERLGNEAAAEADALYDEGHYAAAADKYEDAYNFFVRAEKEDNIPLQDKINQMLAAMQTSYYQGQDFENTIRTIRKRMELEPQNDVYVRQIAQIYERNLNDPESAIDVLKNFDRDNPDFVIRRTIARLYLGMEDNANALTWFNNAFELRQDADVLQNIALLHYRTGNPEAAIRAYEDYLETDPPDNVLVTVYRNMGRFYDDIGDEDKSIEYFERSNQLRFNRDITLLLLTKYYDKGDFLSAMEKVDHLLRDDPRNSNAIYYKGLILFEEGRFSEARAEFERISNDRRLGATARRYIESIDSM
jgi:tetratricopeptide (TPR) repeat protein